MQRQVSEGDTTAMADTCECDQQAAAVPAAAAVPPAAAVPQAAAEAVTTTAINKPSCEITVFWRVPVCNRTLGSLDLNPYETSRSTIQRHFKKWPLEKGYSGAVYW